MAMAVYVALLRGINVGGKNSVSMADLRSLFGELGFGDARTLLQSGNVVFRSERSDVTAMEKELEAAVASRCKVKVDFMVRSAGQVQSVIERNPFAEMAKDDPGHLLVLFLKEPVGEESVAALRGAIKGSERVSGDGREVFAAYPDGVGTSKLTNVVIERCLGTRATGRNWNTVLKLGAFVRSWRSEEPRA